jgi:hypothetical protein
MTEMAMHFRFFALLPVLGLACTARAEITDPICAFALDGVTATSAVEQAKAAWAASGLPYTEEKLQRTAGYPVLTQLRFNRDPAAQARGEWSPLELFYSRSSEGPVNVARVQTDTARLVSTPATPPRGGAGGPR